MSAIPYEDQEEHWASDEQELDTLALSPRRRRRQWFNRRSAVLLALVVGAVGFYAGVQLEKSQLANSSSGGASLPAFAGGASARQALAGTARGGALLSRFGPVGGSGSGSAGTVTDVNGRTLYLKDSTGNTVEVRLSAATKVTKSVNVSRKAVRPGDSVVVQGIKNSNGTLTAASLSDSGAGSASATNSGASSSTNSGSAGSNSGASGVSSLFGSGGG